MLVWRLFLTAIGVVCSLLLGILNPALPALIISCVGILAWGTYGYLALDTEIGSGVQARKKLPTVPEWFTKPYRDKNHCYGCGLDPWIMIPGKAIYCFGCFDYRKAILGSDIKYEDFDKEAWEASLKVVEQKGSAGTIIVHDGDRNPMPSAIGYTDSGIQVRYNYHNPSSEQIEKQMDRIAEKLRYLERTADYHTDQEYIRKFRDLKNEYYELEYLHETAQQQELLRTHYAVPSPIIRHRALNEGPDTWML